MKIEKVNEHQIRCTLTREDLADRELKISELAYGTEKAKSLFRDMMQQAAYECGFEAEDIPLMIEAIPLNAECIVLIITKVEDPEELDTRFAKFAPSVHGDSEEDEDDILDTFADSAGEVLDMLRKMENQSQTTTASEPSEAAPASKGRAPQVCDLSRIFSFASISDVARLAHVINPIYQGYSSLYKNKNNKNYLLAIVPSGMLLSEWESVCHILCEYGNQEPSSMEKKSYLDEHYDVILADKAIPSLAKI
ncbi:MAG: adaptor protein MecA [Lachnospiraceae bacterium]|nr:adaptor protein MecA [Lachnospiraceae bacterium]